MFPADMESASPRCHTLQAAAAEPEELSALCGVGGAQLAMMVDKVRRKGIGGAGRKEAVSLVGRRTLARWAELHDDALSTGLAEQPFRLVTTAGNGFAESVAARVLPDVD